MSTLELGNKAYKVGSSEIDYEPMFKRIEMLGDNLKKMNMLEVVKDVWAFCCVYNRINEEDYLGRINFLTEKNIELNTLRHRQAEELVRCQAAIKHYENQLINAGLLNASETFLAHVSSSKKPELLGESATLSAASTEDTSLSKSSEADQKPTSGQEG